MKRFITTALEKWKDSADRKPLILRGARQVGKTYIVKEFAHDAYQNLAYFNFDHDEPLCSLFDNTKDPQRLISQLALFSGKKIQPGQTLIFFDEIQECPNALNSLKYFQEEAPEYHIIAAGSLLGIRLSHTSFPVGKVDFLDLYPMSFSEFLIADGAQHLVDYLSSLTAIEPLEDIIVSQLEEKLKSYFIVGGMPEAVLAWTTGRDIPKVNRIQRSILNTYEHDFSKHTTEAEANKISLVWNNIPSQLAKENKRFIYNALRPGARARDYEDAIHWLLSAGLIHQVCNVTKPSLPLKAYNDLPAFKLYLGDVGLLRKMSDLGSSIIADGDRLFNEFEGALTENYCLEQLVTSTEHQLYYYTFDDHYEVDFLTQSDAGQIVPIEVKSGKSAPHASFTRYIQQHQPPIAVRFSTNNLKLDGSVLNIPLYLADHFAQLVPLALGS